MGLLAGEKASNRITIVQSQRKEFCSIQLWLAHFPLDSETI
jgi:hypothetical protein